MHEVQDMTFSKAYVKFDNSFFAICQAYVALSRVISLEDVNFIQFSSSPLLSDHLCKNLLQLMNSANEIKSTEEAPLPYPTR